MKGEIISASEYSQLCGYSLKSGRVSQIIKSGKYPAEWIGEPRKSGSVWLLEVDSEWLKKTRKK